jgi:serine O-acetyltransferase
MLKVYNWHYFSHYLYRNKIPLPPKFNSYLTLFIFSAWIPHSASIGKGTVFGYGGLGIVIHGRAVLGEYCHFVQNVTIKGTSKKREVPIIGNYVYIGAGAKILGPIKIGNNVVVGANAVVITDIPDGSLVVGVPAKIVKSGIRMQDYIYTMTLRQDEP